MISITIRALFGFPIHHQKEGRNILQMYEPISYTIVSSVYTSTFWYVYLYIYLYTYIPMSLYIPYTPNWNHSPQKICHVCHVKGPVSTWWPPSFSCSPGDLEVVLVALDEVCDRFAFRVCDSLKTDFNRISYPKKNKVQWWYIVIDVIV